MTITNDPTAVKTVDIQGIVEPVVAGVDSNGQPADVQPDDSVDNPEAYGAYNELKKVWAVPPPKKEVTANNPPAAEPESTVTAREKLAQMNAVPVPFKEGYWLSYEQGGAENYAKARQLSALVEERIGKEFEAKGLRFDHAYVDRKTGKVNVLLQENRENEQAQGYVVATDLTPDDIVSPNSTKLGAKIVSKSAKYERPEHMAVTLDGSTEIGGNEARYEIDSFGVNLSETAKEKLEARYGMEFQGASRRLIQDANGGYLMVYMKDKEGKTRQINLGWKDNNVHSSADGDKQPNDDQTPDNVGGSIKNPPVAEPGNITAAEDKLAQMNAVPVASKEGYWLGYEQGGAETSAEAKELSDLAKVRIGGEYETKGLHFEHAYVNPKTGKLDVLLLKPNEDGEPQYYVAATDLTRNDILSPMSEDLSAKVVSNDRSYEQPKHMAMTLDGGTEVGENEARYEIDSFGVELPPGAKEKLEAKYGMEFQGASRRLIQDANGGYLMVYMKDENGSTHQINLGWKDGSAS